MAEQLMNEPMTEEQVIVEALPVREKKRLSGYDRMKRKNTWLAGNVADLTGDVAALEGLVDTLLSQIDVLISPNVTSEAIDRTRRVTCGIRAALASDDTGGPTS